MFSQGRMTFSLWSWAIQISRASLSLGADYSVSTNDSCVPTVACAGVAGGIDPE